MDAQSVIYDWLKDHDEKDEVRFAKVAQKQDEIDKKLWYLVIAFAVLAASAGLPAIVTAMKSIIG